MKKLALLLAIATASQLDERDQNIPVNDRLFAEAETVSTLQSLNLQEISGIEESQANPGMFWGHNDSGDKARFFLFDQFGEIKSTYFLENAKNRDWEDITLVRDPAGVSLIIGDFGDNLAARNDLQLYKIPEPKYTGEKEVYIKQDNYEVMSFSYKEGPRDAETLMYDFISDSLILVTKREDSVLVYQFAFQSGDTLELKSKGILPFTSFTGGDIRKSGEILMKNYNSVFYWKPTSGSTLMNLLNGPHFRIPYLREPQGESICWTSEGFYTITEKFEEMDQILFFYPEK